MKLTQDQKNALLAKLELIDNDRLSIERDVEDKEKLSISAITDKNGNDIMDGNLEIHIQSLGVNEQYWLDSGEFDF